MSYPGTWRAALLWPAPSDSYASGVIHQTMTTPPANAETYTIEIAPGASTDWTADVLLKIKCAYPIVTTAPPMTISLPARGAEGIDVSRHQGNFDWKAAREAGYKFAYIRTTMGAPSANYTGVDDRWRYNRAACRWGAGIADGVYHYMVHDVSAQAQFDNLSGEIKSDFGSLPIVVDVERRRDANGVPEFVNKLSFTQNLKTFLDFIESAYKHKPLIYTSKIEWEAMTTLPAWESDYGFFVAQYAPTLTAVRPAWCVAAWQYSTGGGALDHDRWLGQDAPAPTSRHNFAPRTNQQVINLFYKVAGPTDYIAWITRAGLSGMFPSAERVKLYVGPDVEAMPLTEAERAALIAAL